MNDLIARLEAWAEACQRYSASIRAKTVLRSAIYREVAQELIAEIQARPMRLLRVDQSASNRAVDAEVKRRLARAISVQKGKSDAP